MSKLEQLKNSIPSGAGIMCDFFIQSAKNSTITTTDGREIIDFAGGIGVLNIGHCHPRVISAVKDQLDKFTHTAFQVIPYESYLELVSMINEVIPIEGNTRSQFFCSGAEAVENAIKIAKSYTKREGIIAFNGAFHGRTHLALGLTGKVNPYQAAFGIKPSGIFHALYPSVTQNISVSDAIKSLHRIFKADIAPSSVAAIIVEPIQGEGGFNVAPNEFMVELRSLCDEHGIVLIFDEVQSGFARSGKLFASEHFSIKPDMITMAKSMAGGFVLSGVSGKECIMNAPNKGGLGGTYAGNPLSLVAAIATMNVIKDENLVQRSNILGDKLKAFLKGLNIKEATDIRGLGSMVAIEFGDDENPNSKLASDIQQEALKNNLLILTCGAHGNIIRFLYPLTIEDALFDKGLEILKNAINKARG